MNGDHESLYSWLAFWSGDYWMYLRNAWDEDSFDPVTDDNIRDLAKVAALEIMYKILKEHSAFPEPVYDD